MCGVGVTNPLNCPPPLPPSSHPYFPSPPRMSGTWLRPFLVPADDLMKGLGQLPADLLGRLASGAGPLCAPR